MEPELIGACGIVVLLLMLYFRIWVGVAMLFVGFWGTFLILGWQPALGVLGSVPYRQVASYTLAALPLFIMMGVILEHTGIGRDLFFSANKWLGQLRGGIAMATAVAAAIIGVITDSMVAAITLGKIALPEMKKLKYDESLSAGSIVAGASLASLVPPSIGFILFGILTGESVGQLFIGAILPGVLLTIIIIMIIFVMVRIKPSIAPPGPKTSFKEKVLSLKYTWASLILIFLIIGGIYGGIFTPTESGAIGAAGSIVIGIAFRRLTRKNLIASILETAQMTAMIILMTAGAFIFSTMITVSQLSFALTDFVVGLDLSRYIIMTVIIIIYLILGMFTDILACILLTVPTIYPVVKALGFDGIWFGVVTVIIIEMGFITPPLGIHVFMFSAVTEVPIGTIFRGVIPFVAGLFLCVIITMFFPEIVTFLPGTMK
ncbi:TRAP transporter large permease [Thermodesulfobacteriota bacterium]